MLLYGRSGLHKTGSVYKALGPLALWLACERNAIAPAVLPYLNEEWRSLGRSPIPDHEYCLSVDDPIGEANHAIDRHLAQIRGGAYRAVVLDTATTLAQRTLQKVHRDGVRDEYGKAAAKVNEELLKLVHRLLTMNLIVIAICHERSPTTIEGKFTMGGPELYGKGVSLLPAQFDVVLHCRNEMSVQGAQVVGVSNELDPMWICKDRWGATGAEKKCNLDELRRVLQESLQLAKQYNGA